MPNQLGALARSDPYGQHLVARTDRLLGKEDREVGAGSRALVTWWRRSLAGGHIQQETLMKLTRPRHGRGRNRRLNKAKAKHFFDTKSTAEEGETLMEEAACGRL